MREDRIDSVPTMECVSDLECTCVYVRVFVRVRVGMCKCVWVCER